MLTVKGLNKSFGENEILKSIDFTINKGQVVAILGPSGSGKTTMLRCLNALEIPNAGSFTFDDFSIDFSKKINKLICSSFAGSQAWCFKIIICSRIVLFLRM